jgi:orotate phosphoribosyltransferase
MRCVPRSLSSQELLRALEQRGALLEGHFRLSSGRHSDRFVQKFRLLENPALVTLAATALIREARPERAGVVVSAAVGGIVLGFEVARQLGVRAIFVEKVAGVPVLRRGFTLDSADSVFVVEDVMTTGGSVREVLALIAERGSCVLGVGAIVQRAEVDVGVPVTALVEMDLESFSEEECPQCKRGVALLDPGSRRLSARP